MSRFAALIVLMGIVTACDEAPPRNGDTAVDTVDDGSGAADTDPADTPAEPDDAADTTVPDSEVDTPDDGRDGDADTAPVDVDALGDTEDVADAADTGSKEDADAADGSGDVGPITALMFVYDTSGGFTGAGTTDISLDGGGVMHVSGGPVPACDGAPDTAEMEALLAAAAAVEWESVAGDYFPPANPFCCCDQYQYELSVSVTVSGAGATSATVRWCDQSFAEDLVPPDVVSFMTTVATVMASVVARECEAD